MKTEELLGIEILSPQDICIYYNHEGGLIGNLHIALWWYQFLRHRKEGAALSHRLCKYGFYNDFIDEYSNISAGKRTQ